MSATTPDDLDAVLDELNQDLNSWQAQSPGDTVEAEPPKPKKIIVPPLPADGYVDPPWWPAFLRALKRGRPVLLKGPAGDGKTLGALTYGRRAGLTPHIVQGYRDITIEELRGSPSLVADKGVSITKFVHAVIARSLQDQKGYLIFDEVNMAPDNFLPVLNIILDDHGGMPVPETGEWLERGPNWRCIFTCNPTYLGTSEIPEPLISRCVVIDCDYLPGEVERQIVHHKHGMPVPEATAVVAMAQAVRKSKQNGDHQFDFCLRTMAQLSEEWLDQPKQRRSLIEAFKTVVLPKIGNDPNEATTQGARKGLLEAVKGILASGPTDLVS